MDPNKWGPVTWRVLHGLVEEYVPALHESYQGLFYSLAATLPCSKCRNNYVLKLIERPFPCDRSIVVVRNWLIDIHNAVNTDLRKPVLSRKKAREKIVPLKQGDVKKMLGFIRTNMVKNRPPRSYRAGLKILEQHLGQILSVVTSFRKISPPAPPRRRPPPRSRSAR